MAEVIAQVNIDDILAEFKAKEDRDKATQERVKQDSHQSTAINPATALAELHLSDVFADLERERVSKEEAFDSNQPQARISRVAIEEFYELKDPRTTLSQRIGESSWERVLLSLNEKAYHSDSDNGSFFAQAGEESLLIIEQLDDEGFTLDLYDGSDRQTPILSGALCPPTVVGAEDEGWMVFTPAEPIVSALHPSDGRNASVNESPYLADSLIVSNLSRVGTVVQQGELHPIK